MQASERAAHMNSTGWQKVMFRGCQSVHGKAGGEKGIVYRRAWTNGFELRMPARGKKQGRKEGGRYEEQGSRRAHPGRLGGQPRCVVCFWCAAKQVGAGNPLGREGGAAM